MKKAIIVGVVIVVVAVAGILVARIVAKKSGPGRAGRAFDIEPALPEEITYEGVVTDIEGNPVPNVTVRSYLRDYKLSALTQKIEISTVTNENGRFILGPLSALDEHNSNRILLCEHPDYAVGWFSDFYNEDSDLQSLEIKLAPPAGVAGIVFDNKGAPVADAIVDAVIFWRHDGNNHYLQLHRHSQLSFKTNDKGQFRLEKIPQEARLRLEVRHPDYAFYVTPEEHGTSLNTLAGFYPIPAGEENIRVDLKVGASIEGRLVVDGQPFKRQDIVVFANPRRANQKEYALTDEEGKFSITSLNTGNYSIYVEAEALAGFELICLPQFGITAKAGMPGEPIDLELTRGEVVRGRVIDKDSKSPLGGREIRAIPRPGTLVLSSSAFTDAKGRFAVRLAPGEYRLRVRSGSRLAEGQTIRIETGAEPPKVLLAVEAPPQIIGQLVDAKGNPVQGTVTLDSGTPATTDKKGKFSLPPPIEGGKRVNIGFAFDSKEELGCGFLFPPKKKEEPLKLVLKPLSTIVGRVVYDRNLRIPRPALRLDVGPLEKGAYRGLPRAPWRIEQAYGEEFEIHSVPVGLPLRLTVGTLKFGDKLKLPEVKPGGTLDLGDIVLGDVAERPAQRHAPGMTSIISGILIDENSRPVVGARVSVDVAGTQARDLTDQNGRFRLTQLPVNQRVRLEANVPGYGLCRSEDIQTGSANVQFQIFPQGYEWYGMPPPVLHVEKWINCEPQYLNKLTGKVVLLHIGGHIQNYSRHVGPIQDALEKYGDKGLAAIGIHWFRHPDAPRYTGDLPKASDKEIGDFLKRNKITFPFGVDEYREGSEQGLTYEAYGVRTPPVIYLIDKKGNLRRSVGWQDLDEWIEKLLAE